MILLCIAVLTLNFVSFAYLVALRLCLVDMHGRLRPQWGLHYDNWRF